MNTDPIRQRLQFMKDHATGRWSMSELCERFRVSRPTGYKWLTRFREKGVAGLVEEPRAPQTSPCRTESEVEELVLALRHRYGWGAKKLLKVMERRHPEVHRPARSTVNSILDKAGLLKKQRRASRRWHHPGAGQVATERPNQVWPADFKGQFRTGDGKYCYPLTVTDHYSRRLMMCAGMTSTLQETAMAAFKELFLEVGLPEAIRTDNGTPFASSGIHGLSRLNVWWMKLGIVHQRTRPASPQQNGQHERMHRELKAETARPPARNLKSQQRRMDDFQCRYNEERPHEALDGDVPNSLWAPSERPYPKKLSTPEYPAPLEVRLVASTGAIRFHTKTPFISQALAGEYIGLEEIDNGLWNIVYYNTLLGRYDEERAEISGADTV